MNFTYEEFMALKNAYRELLDAVKAAELHIHDEIAKLGPRADGSDSDLLGRLQDAIVSAEGHEEWEVGR